MAVRRSSVRTGQRMMRTVALATFVGTALETYDFVLYAQAAALVFGEVFFSRLSPASGTLAAFATFAVAFVARPIGAVVFGHFGDRIGRRSMLIVALVLSGSATVGIGLLPGYDSIGLPAPAILVLLRFMQGVGLGGEWSGAILLAVEHAPAGRRGRYASFTQIGAIVGPLLASGAMLTLSATLSDEAFRSWGWRVAFLAGGVLMAVGLYVRLAVGESPLFVSEVTGVQPALPGTGAGGRRRAEAAARRPVWEAVRRQRWTLLLGTGALIVVYMLAAMVTAFTLAYGVGLGVARTTMLAAVLIASLVNIPAVALIAALSDRVGRRPVCLVGAVAAMVWAYPLLALIRTRSALWITVSLAVAVVVASLIFAPMGAYLPELFETRWRYSGVALSSSLAAILGGGLAPIIATALLTIPGSVWWITGYLAAMALLSLGCLLALPETYQRDLARSSGTGRLPGSRTASGL